MLLEKIIIENIRSHKYVKFEPSLTGMTAITGVNGAGKSTIVDSFAWCLYGIRPNALKNSELIKYDVNPKEERVGVIVYMKIGNKYYKIDRRILSPSGNAECLVYSKNNKEDNNWNKESGPSISHAESYIRSVLGFDEKGFLSSIFVQQKEVDSIINASPKERSQAIEKLIGITAITDAISMAKEEARALQKAANLVNISLVDEVEKQIEEQKNIVLELKDKIEKLSKKVDEDEKDFNILFAEYEKESKLQEEKNDLDNKLLNEKNTLKILNDKLKQQIDLIESSIDDELNIPIKIVQDELSQINSLVKQLEKKTTELKTKNLYLEKLFNQDVSDYKKIQATIKEQIGLLNKKSDELNILNLEVLSLKEKIKNNNEYIKLLKSENVKSCRLCGQEIKNIKEELVKHENEQKEFKNLFLEKNERKNLLEDEINLLNKELKLNENNFHNLSSIVEEQKSNKKEFKDVKLNLKKTTTELEVEKENLKIVQNKYIQSLAQEEKREMIKLAKSQIKTTEEEINNTNKNLSIIIDNISKCNALSKNEFRSMNSSLKEKESNLNKNKLLLEKTRGDYNTHIVKGKMLVEELKTQLKANKEYSKLMDQLSVMNLSSQTLAQFKSERIKYSIPALTNLASEILDKFTEGTFTKLILTEKFETFVLRGGQNIEVPVKHLSGGELSAVAIALRLAIALFLNNGEQNLLILDEILVSMNSDRSHLILETISSFTKAQIIIIAHNDSINSFADKVFSL